MLIFEEESIRVSEEELEGLLELVPQAQSEALLRHQFILGTHAVDFNLLRAGCNIKDCVRNKVEFHKQRNIEIYNNTMKKCSEMLIGSTIEAQSTANHKFYDALFHDCILVIEEFNSAWELTLWEDVHEEYIEKYPDYGEEFNEDPLGFAVSRTFKPIIEVGTSIFKGIVSGTNEALFGEDWKKKLIIGGIAIGGIAIGGLILYNFSKSFISEKARQKAGGAKKSG